MRGWESEGLLDELGVGHIIVLGDGLFLGLDKMLTDGNKIGGDNVWTMDKGKNC